MKELTPSVVECLSGKTFLVSRLPISSEEKHTDSPLNSALVMPLKDMHYKQCHACSNTCFDYCWNCECPICKEHAFAVFIKPMFILTVCSECRDSLQFFGDTNHVH